MTDSTDRLVAVLREADGNSLRDAWLFDEQSYEPVYVRDDVRDQIVDVEVERYIDNERYGYITRDTYESLHYTDYEYTVRGFDEFVQYRTFLPSGDGRVGLMASYDPDTPVEFKQLTARLTDVARDVQITVGE